MQDLKWFQDRIGKKVFRKPNNPPCGCNTCNDIEKNGLEITDKDHADYMYEVQCEFYAGGHDVEYQDTPHI